MSIICVGDIHGMRKHFNGLWDQLQPSKDDTIVILGDMIDRGPDPKGVVQDILDRQADGFNIIALQGNHEDMYMACLDGINAIGNGEEDIQENICDVFLFNGGNTTSKSYGRIVPDDDHLDFFRSLPLKYETDEYFFCHAGVDPNKSLQNQTGVDLLWIREKFLYSPKDFGKLIVFGHTPTMMIHDHKSLEPFVTDTKIGIDTGCVFGGRLTALILPEFEYLQV